MAVQVVPTNSIKDLAVTSPKLSSSLSVGTVQSTGLGVGVAPLAGGLAIGTTNERIRNPVNATANLSIESADGNLFVCGGSQAFLTYNAYWDGASWQRFAVGSAASYFYESSGGLIFATTPSGANPISGFTTRFTVDPSGNTTITGGLTVNGTVKLPTNSIQQLLGQYLTTPSWNTTVLNTWVQTAVSVAFTTGGGLLRFEFNGPFQHTNANAGFYYGFAFDGVSPSAYWYAITSPTVSSPMQYSGIYYATLAAGAHTVYLVVYNTGTGTLTQTGIAFSALFVTEQKA